MIPVGDIALLLMMLAAPKHVAETMHNYLLVNGENEFQSLTQIEMKRKNQQLSMG